MALTRTQIKSRVQAITARDDKDTLVENMLDLHLKQFCQLYRFRSMVEEADVSTVASQGYVALPSDFQELIQALWIDSTQSWEIKVHSKKWVLNRWPNISAESDNRSVVGYIDDSKLYLLPEPDDVYTVRLTYLKIPADFASDATANPVPKLDLALVYICTSEVYSTIENYSKSQLFYKRAMDSAALAAKTDRFDPAERFQAEGAIEAVNLNKATDYLDPFAGHSRVVR